MKGFRGEWVVKPNGNHFTIVGTKRLPRKTKKFCTTILNSMDGTCVITSIAYAQRINALSDQLKEELP